MRSSEVEESIFHPRKDGGGIMMILLFLESARTMARDSERGREREREKKLIARGIIREDRRPSGRYSFPVIVVQPITHA